MSDYRFGAENYRLNYRPHEVMDKDGYIDWEKVEAVEIDRVDFIRKPDGKSRWAELFGTPERAARTLERMDVDVFNWCVDDDGNHKKCGECPYEYDYYGCTMPEGLTLLKWLRGDAE